MLREARSAQSADAPVHTFRYVRYRDAKGMFATGWVAAEGLVPLTTPLSVNPACKKWAHKEMPQRERMPPLLIIIIRLQATIAHGFIPCQRNSAAASPFLVPGDIISTQEQSKDDFIEAVYYTTDRHIVRGWLKSHNSSL